MVLNISLKTTTTKTTKTAILTTLTSSVALCNNNNGKIMGKTINLTLPTFSPVSAVSPFPAAWSTLLHYFNNFQRTMAYNNNHNTTQQQATNNK